MFYLTCLFSILTIKCACCWLKCLSVTSCIRRPLVLGSFFYRWRFSRCCWRHEKITNPIQSPPNAYEHFKSRAKATKNQVNIYVSLALLKSERTLTQCFCCCCCCAHPFIHLIFDVLCVWCFYYGLLSKLFSIFFIRRCSIRLSILIKEIHWTGSARRSYWDRECEWSGSGGQFSLDARSSLHGKLNFKTHRTDEENSPKFLHKNCTKFIHYTILHLTRTHLLRGGYFFFHIRSFLDCTPYCVWWILLELSFSYCSFRILFFSAALQFAPLFGQRCNTVPKQKQPKQKSIWHVLKLRKMAAICQNIHTKTTDKNMSYIFFHHSYSKCFCFDFLKTTRKHKQTKNKWKCERRPYARKLQLAASSEVLIKNQIQVTVRSASEKCGKCVRT